MNSRPYRRLLGAKYFAGSNTVPTESVEDKSLVGVTEAYVGFAIVLQVLNASPVERLVIVVA